MRCKSVFGLISRLLVLVSFSVAVPSRSQILTNNLFPVVTIKATSPLASWSGTPGTFTVFRDGPTNATLNVYYLIAGSASNGVDYAMIPNTVAIPAGTRTNTITISPINNGQTNVETVFLKLAYSPLMPPINYTIGYPSSATVFIAPAGVTNIPPVVKIFSPTNGAVFLTPTDISLGAVAYDPDGSVSSVEFFAGTNSLGLATGIAILDPPFPDGMGPGARGYFLVWTNPAPGDYVLTAKATDNGGASTISDPVDITVQQGPPPPPPTNYPPIVRIISPPNGAMFRSPVDLPIYAYAKDPDGQVVSVGFFAGTNSLGLGTGLCLGLAGPFGPLGPIPFNCPTNLFVLIWSNAPQGSFALTATATDDGGASTVSSAVNVTILPPPPPPPTNRPPIVSIVASDPLAIEGTNCWPWLGLGGVTPTWGNWNTNIAVWKFFTNCGPKNAAFTVRRAGETNQDLLVTYGVGGSATNGVDYVPLIGSVTIPAGQRHAFITLVPIDDGPPDITSTVILKLTPSTNYVVGFPRDAAALILDGPLPRPFTGILPDKSFELSAPGPDGAWFHVEFSTDLLNWTSICTNQVVEGTINFIDPDAQTAPSRFYRAVPDMSPPLN